MMMVVLATIHLYLSQLMSLNYSLDLDLGRDPECLGPDLDPECLVRIEMMVVVLQNQPDTVHSMTIRWLVRKTSVKK